MAAMHGGAGCVAAVALFAASCGTAPAEPARNLVLISIDTLRADRLGSYGYDRGTSPELDAFAERGALFEDVVTECSWTLPAHMTMLSGLAPPQHGVIRPELGLGAGTELLAQRLAAAGFRTFGATEGGFVSRRYGFARGFERFDDEQTSLAESLTDARAFLVRMRREGAARSFLFVHTFAVHCPYEPDPATAALFHSPDAEPVETAGRCGNPDFNHMELTVGEIRTISDLYDAEIRDADAVLGEFLRWLDAEGFAETTLVVVTSDHGEEFGEHGRIGHEGTLHREVLGVPLILVGPGIPHGRFDRPAGLASIVPTLLAALGLPSGGPSLFDDQARAVSERFSSISWKGRAVSVVTEEWHLILDEENGEVRLYRRADVGEEVDLARSRPDLVADLRACAEAYAASRRVENAVLLDAPNPRERVRLGELGYAEGGD
ncbi:MAG TPA: hypothetical protein ENJ09_14720 [Planctomycetes bacterium]|nr:hypothetical protein [Planctomycetota bacterium]